MASDGKHLKSYGEIHDGMRLDYPNSEFAKTNATECISIRFKSPDIDKLEIPRNFDNGGTLNNPSNPSPYNKNLPPFTGHGFTSGTKGKLGVPEWRTDFPNVLTIESGAEMYHINAAGEEILIGIYNSDLKKFIAP